MKQAVWVLVILAISLVLTAVNFGRIPGVLLQLKPEGKKRAGKRGQDLTISNTTPYPLSLQPSSPQSDQRGLIVDIQKQLLVLSRNVIHNRF